MPIVDGLEQEFSGQARVYRLDAGEAENAQLMQQFGLRGHPTFAVLDENGRVQQTFSGPQTADTLRTALQSA